MRSYAALSDYDFEVLVADLLGTELGIRFETFARGADGGVDLRRLEPGDGRPDVVQCKHLLKSSFAKLKSAVGKEPAKLAALDPPPRTYRLVTSQSLTAARKDKLVAAAAPWIASPADILGAEDLDTLLDRHPAVERHHVKLWLTGGTQLDALINAGIYARSEQLLSDTQAQLSRYVQSAAFADARERLHKERVLIVAGVAGIGKTTLARMLMADAAIERYEPVDVSGDIEEAYAMFKADVPQIFYYDDFLGTTFLRERLRKNEDKRIVAFLRKVARSKTSLLVMTTREYILRQATTLYEEFDREGLQAQRFVLELPRYSLMDRALILYNHIWESGQLTRRARRALHIDQGYNQILDHPNYNPRLIEYVTGLASKRLGAPENADYLTFAVGVLDDPSLIWRHAFEQQLDQRAQMLLVCAASFPTPVRTDHLEQAFHSICAAAGVEARGRSFTETLNILDDSFLKTSHDSDVGGILVSLANPSIGDFVSDWLREAPGEALAAIEGAHYFAQLEWLFRRVVGRAPAARALRLRSALAAAVRRVFDSIDTQWHDVYWGDEAQPRTSINIIDTTERIDWVLLFIQRDTALGELIESWFEETLAKVSATWPDGVYRASSVPTLVLGLRDAGRLTPAIRRDARRWAFDPVNPPTYSFHWDQSVDLLNGLPDLLTLAEQEAFRTGFARWANRTLESADVNDSHDLETITGTAYQLGVDLDDGALDFARHELSDRESTDERRAEAELEHRRSAADDPELTSSLQGEPEIDLLFARLANRGR
jgi:conflict system STAND superfamily ATPase